MEKKCLIIVPHPDDEINVAGGIFDQLKNHKVDVTVAVCTNGDFVASNADVRIHETLKAKKILNYDHLIILGYGDNYQNSHIYDAINDDVAVSRAGYNQTYNAGGLETFHYSKYKSQSLYTRENLKNDIKELILDIAADILICVDTDNHPDHRAVSLLFDEAMGEILRSRSYSPILLKKFAYLGTYFGIDDYFSYRMIETLPSYENDINEEYSYPYNWNDRISIGNSKKNYPLAFWNSPIFKALLCHKSQNVYLQYVGICNSDIIYWYRSTKSLTYDVKIEASSGDVSYLNDFKIVDTDNILSKNIVIEPSLTKAWIPSKEDKKHYVKYLFPERKDVSFLIIYQAPFSHISQIKVLIDNGKTFLIDCNDTNILKIEIPIQYGIQSMSLFFITASLSSNIAIYEIEIYKEQPLLPWKALPFDEYNHALIVSRKKYLLSFYSYVFELHQTYRSSILKNLRSYWWRLEYRLNRIFNK